MVFPASGIGRVQSAADCDGDVVAEGNVSAESSKKMISPAVADPPEVNPSRPGAAGNTVDPKPAKTLQRNAVSPTKRVGIRG